MTTPDLDTIRAAMRAHMLTDETAAVMRLIETADLPDGERAAISASAAGLVKTVRGSSAPTMMESFLGEYGLSTGEGVALMCLAEALLRVPDAETVDDLIRDKITPHDWSAHQGHSSSVMVNASTWALMLTGRVLDDEEERGIEGTLLSLVRRLGEPVIRRAVGAAMREMGDQFVLGRTISEAVKRGRDLSAKGYLYSYDMLGEAARTAEDAERYFQAYARAIADLARSSNKPDIRQNPGISVKLSALHPRYEAIKSETMLPDMAARLLTLAQAARDARMGLNIDAEEVDRLDISLDVIERVLADPSLEGWDGFGVVVQAYGPRAPFVLDWLHGLAEKHDRRIMVRLVKGAYWDSEIKRAQVMGLAGYPVFTRKTHTDVSYLACARKLLAMTDRIYPQFATHNAHTAAAILAMAPDRDCFEFQRLHGMGETLHEAIRKGEGTRCRIYAPVGQHSDLLAYLVRRLLENGANSSFVHQIVDEDVPPEEIARDPIAAVLADGAQPNPAIRRPADVFKPDRANSRGRDFTDPLDLSKLEAARAPFMAPYQWQAHPTVPGRPQSGETHAVVNPAVPSDVVGHCRDATSVDVAAAFDQARAAQGEWDGLGARQRAVVLSNAAALYEKHAEEFYALCAREAGKTLADAIAEVREAIDFLHYYAAEAVKTESATKARGVIACISPWNFPLAIFTGQVAAGLVTGNAVLAKPAEQTPLIAARAVALLHQAGVPDRVLHLLPGNGETVGAALTSLAGLNGVCFTGSTEVARIIERQLAKTGAADAMLIAETGGLNAMIVDSTALPEQAVRDAVASAFQSAGQRCSALRVLYVQEDVADKVTTMLTGAMEALSVGDPSDIATDVGPVIDEEARASITAYCEEKAGEGRLVARLDAPADGLFVGPHILRVRGIEEMEREIFGPVLHLATFRAEDLDKVIAAVNGRGYGLTFGLHTRIDDRVQHVVDRIHAGNVYVNRNQIGAIVGSQPFGGEGLSGTGPKAGGPLYLRRFRKVLADGETGSLGGAAVSDLPVPDAEAALQWAGRHDRINHLRKVLRGRAGSAVAAAAGVDQGPVDLPGPTGEGNSLTLAARGLVLCLGPAPEVLLDQVVQALAFGNAVAAIAPGAEEALKPLTGQGLPLAIAEGTATDALLGKAPVDAVALHAGDDDLRRVRRDLAARAGPIVRLIDERLAPSAYVHERALCVDTTAAGGNASLLAAAG
ncbi:bifunctional proline dehydrogenase/L-glutamate gamma-semialdehyde dehydrogenase [Zhengella mangrovi]|uniref:Bifunctional protein PutA n=1 Tax=Zhengella mangrovi TaxID=1982044 RepID=A0A2G1QPT3_9HYPH|nr:bifunctional proline dehydrogenase/L-glutamate gamma-semialdehyde dehydrogenase PutA [Zhengella mangrovi]PHP67470.1 bifunctional proline dehydrogenase/L-glutamate gamma-semialdehyde dehydrogenase [Zhengella mangrovi]